MPAVTFFTAVEAANLYHLTNRSVKNAYPKIFDGFMNVAVTDTLGKVIYVNEKFCQFTGYSEVEVIGRPISIMKSGHHSKEFFQQQWQTINRGRMWHGEMLNKRKDGSLYWVDTFIIPELDEHQQPKYFWSFRTDITEQKEGERKVQQLIDNIDSAFVWMIDSGYRLKIGNKNLINKLRQSYGVEQCMEVCLLDLPLSEEKRELWKRYYDRALAGEAFSEEMHMPELNSTMLAFFTPVRTGENKIEGVSVCQLNITVEKEKQQFILQQHALLMEIAHLQSHKIRGPLSTILGLISLIDQSTLCDHNREMFNHMLTTCKALDSMVHTIVRKTGSLQFQEDANSQMGR